MQTHRTNTDRPATTQTSATAPAVQNTDPVDELLDDFLDEIDAILENNALETVRMYLQKGGQ